MQRLPIGTVGKPHGLLGAVYVRTDAPEVLEPGRTVWIDGREHEISSVQLHGERMLATFAGIGDRNTAESLRGGVITAERAVIHLGADEFLVADTIGLPVRVEGQTGTGSVADVVTNAPQHRLIVEWHGRRVEVPLHPDIATVGVDEVMVRPPPGLFDPENAVEAGS